MSDCNKRPNLHTVTADDPTFLFHCGEGYERHRLPVGTTVVYPNLPDEPLPDRRAAIVHAIDNPENSDPLDAHLKPGMKVTIAFDDVSLPLPGMAKPDIRQTVIDTLALIMAVMYFARQNEANGASPIVPEMAPETAPETAKGNGSAHTGSGEPTHTHFESDDRPTRSSVP